MYPTATEESQKLSILRKIDSLILSSSSSSSLLSDFCTVSMKIDGRLY